MQDLIAKAMALQKQLVVISNDLRTGGVPSVYELMAIYGDLNNLFFDVSQYQVQAFSYKEKAYIERKVREASDVNALRRENNVSDSNAIALEKSKEMRVAEIDRATEYEHLRLLLRSIDNSLQFVRSLKTTIERAESNI